MCITLRRSSRALGAFIASGVSSGLDRVTGRPVRLCLAAVLLTGMVRCGAARAAGLDADGQGDGALCQTAVALVERQSTLPRQLLSAISLVESGRPAPGGRVTAWPWTVNVGGIGTFYETAGAAVAAVEALQAAGVRSIDVGCMQVNLMYHPKAFASLRDAFDPVLNAAYAARFLGQLHTETGEWSRAVAAYHSRTPDLATDYTRKVARMWPDNAGHGLVTSPEVDRLSGSGAPHSLQTPEFAARLRQAAADHAELTRTVVGPAWPGSRLRQGSRQRLWATWAGSGIGAPLEGGADGNGARRLRDGGRLLAAGSGTSLLPPRFLR